MYVCIVYLYGCMSSMTHGVLTRPTVGLGLCGVRRTQEGARARGRRAAGFRHATQAAN